MNTNDFKLQYFGLGQLFAHQNWAKINPIRFPFNWSRAPESCALTRFVRSHVSFDFFLAISLGRCAVRRYYFVFLVFVMYFGIFMTLWDIWLKLSPVVTYTSLLNFAMHNCTGLICSKWDSERPCVWGLWAPRIIGHWHIEIAACGLKVPQSPCSQMEGPRTAKLGQTKI